jgi:hypothetical protein
MESSDDDAITKPKATPKPVSNTEEPVKEQKEPKPKKTYARKAKDVVQNTLKGTAKGKKPQTQQDIFDEIECDLEREEALLARLEAKAAKRKALQAELRQSELLEQSEPEIKEEPIVEKKESNKNVVKQKKAPKKVVEETDTESDSESSVEIVIKKKTKAKPEPKPKKKKKIVIEQSDSETDDSDDSDGPPPQPTSRATKSQQNRVSKIIPKLPESKYYFA